MTIHLNGKKHSLDSSISIESLLASIGFANKPVVVELNKKALFPRDYAETMLEDGDNVEVITISAGG